MSQAIVTKYIGPTEHRGTRVKATCQAGTLTVAWDHSVGVDENHLAAAQALARRLGWLKRADIWGGALPGDTGYAFVIVGRR